MSNEQKYECQFHIIINHKAALVDHIISHLYSEFVL